MAISNMVRFAVGSFTVVASALSIANVAFANTAPFPYKGGEIPTKAGCATVDPNHTQLCNNWFNAPSTPAGSTNVNANTNTLAPTTVSKAEAEAWAKANANASAKQKLDFAAHLANQNKIDLATANNLVNSAYGGNANANVTQGSNSLNNNNVTFGSVAPAAISIPGGTCVASVTYPSGLRTDLATPMASKSIAVGGNVGVGNGYTGVGGSFSSANAEGTNVKGCSDLQINVKKVEARAVEALNGVTNEELILGRPPVQVAAPSIVNNQSQQVPQSVQPVVQPQIQRGRQN